MDWLARVKIPRGNYANVRFPGKSEKRQTRAHREFTFLPWIYELRGGAIRRIKSVAETGINKIAADARRRVMS